MPDVFISYAREEQGFVRRLVHALEEHGTETWVDFDARDNLPSADWLREIEAGIEGSHTFLFVVSPASLASPVCRDEVDLAVRSARRIVPVQRARVDHSTQDVPEAVGSPNWIQFLDDGEFAAGFDSLTAILDTGLDWLRTHLEVERAAAKWDAAGRVDALLLRGQELTKAQEWLAAGGQSKAASRITGLQRDYIARSEAASEEARSRRLAQYAQSTSGHDLSLLLAAEAVAVADTDEAVGSLLSALETHPHLDRWLRGPSRELTTVAFHPEGEYVFAGTLRGQLCAWRVGDGEFVLEQRFHTAPDVIEEISGIVADLAISPDGTLVALAMDDVVLWSAQTGEQVGRPIRARARTVAFSPDGRSLAWAGAGGSIHTLDLEKGFHLDVGGLAIAEGAIAESTATHEGGVTALEFSPDGTTFVTGGRDGSVRRWSVSDGSSIGDPLLMHAEQATAIAFTSDGRALASASSDGTVVLWNAATGEPLVKPLIHDWAGVLSVAFSRDDRLLASTIGDGTVALWDLENLTRKILRGHDGVAGGVAFSPVGDIMASAGTDKAVILWTTDRASPLHDSHGGHSDRVSALAFAAQRSRLATGGWDGKVHVIDREEATYVTLDHQQKVTAVDLDGDGALVATATYGWLVRLWDGSDGALLAELGGHNGSVFDLGFNRDATLLASASADGSVRLWETGDGEHESEALDGDGAHLTSVTFSPGGDLLVAGSERGALVVWDVDGRMKLREPVDAHRGAVTSLAFHPGGEVLATGGADETIRLWDVETWEQLERPFHPSRGSVFSIEYSPDGTLLACGNGDRTMNLWRVPSYRLLSSKTTGHWGEVMAVAFSGDGRWLAAGVCADEQGIMCQQGLTILKRVDVAAWLEEAQRIANRELTDEERSRYR